MNAERGADNLATRCLRVRPGEVVRVFTYQADAVFEIVTRALERAGGRVQRIELEPFARDATTARAQVATAAGFAGATASLFLAAPSIPTSLSIAVLQAAERARARHLHVPSAEIRVLGQSARADPDLLSVINARLITLLRPPVRVRTTGENGTDVDITLGPQFPLVSMTGRPEPGETDNLPSGYVYTFPQQIYGVFIADRGIKCSQMRLTSAELRRNPVKFTILDGRVTEVSCGDASVCAAVEEHLASHPNAAKVGQVAFPTNYLARFEIGFDMQDRLLPGMYLGLGFTAAEVTRAPFEAPVQMLALGRRLTVEVRGQRIVHAGRLENSLVEGIDPFR